MSEPLFAVPTDASPVDDRPSKVNERHMLDLLAKRYTKVSMGAHRYAYAEHVPSTTSWFAKTRIADAIAIDCYVAQNPRTPDRYEIHGHEVKVSRSDWLAELRQPEKSEAFRPFVHRWWLVVSDRRIVRDGELPDGWGLMVKAGDLLRVTVRAPLLEPLSMPNDMVAALMRATAKTARREVSA